MKSCDTWCSQVSEHLWISPTLWWARWYSFRKASNWHVFSLFLSNILFFNALFTFLTWAKKPEVHELCTIISLFSFLLWSSVAVFISWAQRQGSITDDNLSSRQVLVFRHHLIIQSPMRLWQILISYNDLHPTLFTCSPKNPTVLGCIAGSALLRRAASLAFENKKRSTLTTDIIEFLWRRYCQL